MRVITDAISADQGYINKAVELIGSKELLIYDLGYFKQEAMMDMSDKEAYFLSRYSHRTGIYTKTEEGGLVNFDIVERLKKAVVDEIALCEYEVRRILNGFQKKSVN